MQFNSYECILIFLPLLLAGYFLLNRLHLTAGKLYLTGMSAVFYCYVRPVSGLVLLASLLVNYAAAALLARPGTRGKPILTTAVAANLFLLFYYKYVPFVLDNVNLLLGRDLHLDVLLPLGISFFTFQQISYLLHVRETGRNEKPLDYLLYILYFPKLVMGPLAEPGELIPQFDDPARKRPDARNFACGLRLFAYGLFKKMLLADTFAAAVGWCFADPGAVSSADAALSMLAYTFEIYFDFSGYCDMALGISRMLNIELPINFDSPYQALSIRDFWKRWHMTLTGFLTRNVYIPLGGSRRGKLRQYANVLIVFLVSGIWHGANWTFFLWGFLHGLLSVGERIFDRALSRLNAVVRWAGSFLCVNVLWLLFRAESVSQWLRLCKTMLRFESTTVSPELLACFEIPEAALLSPLLHLSFFRGGMALLFYLAAFGLCLVPANNARTQDRLLPAGMALAAAALLLGFLHLGRESVFVYFNF